jgi:hypothetical protein
MNMEENIIEIDLGDYYNEAQHNLSQYELSLAASKMGRINIDAQEVQRVIISGSPTQVSMWLHEKA